MPDLLALGRVKSEEATSRTEGVDPIAIESRRGSGTVAPLARVLGSDTLLPLEGSVGDAKASHEFFVIRSIQSVEAISGYDYA